MDKIELEIEKGGIPYLFRYRSNNDFTIDEIKNKNVIATMIIHGVSPYLFTKINEFFNSCGFKKAEGVSNTWILKSITKLPSIYHYQHLKEVLEKDLESLCSFKKTEFPVKGVIQVSGDHQGHYYFSISCDAEAGPKLDITPVEY